MIHFFHESVEQLLTFLTIQDVTAASIRTLINSTLPDALAWLVLAQTLEGSCLSMEVQSIASCAVLGGLISA
jgi:hypothetical protein